MQLAALESTLQPFFIIFCGYEGGHIGGHLEFTCSQSPWLKENILVEFLISKNLCLDTNFVQLGALKTKLQLFFIILVAMMAAMLAAILNSHAYNPHG